MICCVLQIHHRGCSVLYKSYFDHLVIPQVTLNLDHILEMKYLLGSILISPLCLLIKPHTELFPFYSQSLLFHKNAIQKLILAYRVTLLAHYPITVIKVI